MVYVQRGLGLRCVMVNVIDLVSDDAITPLADHIFHLAAAAAAAAADATTGDNDVTQR